MSKDGLQNLHEALIKRRKKKLHEGERAYGSHWYNATAQMNYGVQNPDGPLESAGPMLENDSRLIERHIAMLTRYHPLEAVMTNLLEQAKYIT